MLITKPLEAIGVLGTIYEFELAGDTLEPHIHETHELNHMTVVAAGKFEILGDARWNGKQLIAGQVLDWPVGVEHGFRALTPGSKIVNIRKTLPMKSEADNPT